MSKLDEPLHMAAADGDVRSHIPLVHHENHQFTLYSTHLLNIHIKAVPPLWPSKTYLDCFPPLGVLGQCEMNVMWWAFGTGISWDQVQSLSPQLATSVQLTHKGFPLLECCHKTYIELIPWHRTWIATNLCFQMFENLGCNLRGNAVGQCTGF